MVDAVGRPEERSAGEGVAASGDAPTPVDLAGLVLARRQAEMRADVGGTPEPVGTVDGRLEASAVTGRRREWS